MSKKHSKFLKKIIADKLSEIEPYNKKKLKLLFTEHHLDGSSGARLLTATAFPGQTEAVVAGLGENSAADYGDRPGDSRRFPYFCEPVLAGRLVWLSFLSDQLVSLRDFDIDRFIAFGFQKSTERRIGKR